MNDQSALLCSIMNIVATRLNHFPFLILDGALATELERKGADLNDPLWSAKVLLENPSLIEETHLDYLRAGADIICTATYQATLDGFVKQGFSALKAESLFELSVHLAKEARAVYLSENSPVFSPLVAGSIGSYGAYLADGSEYTGDYVLSKDELKAFHRHRIEILLEQGVDLLIFETFPNFSEVQAINELLVEYSPCPAMFSVSCKTAFQLADGHSLQQAFEAIEQNDQILAYGINCLHPELATAVLKNCHSKIEKNLMVYPNNGDTWDAANKCWINADLGLDITEHWNDWLRNEAKIIGGCCNTTPSYIEKLNAFREEGYDIGR